MLRKLFWTIGVLIAGFLIYSCLDPYTVDIEGVEDLLVVDGLITDENKTHEVILRRSTSEIDEDSPYESGATVYVTNGNGEAYYFTEESSGIYVSDSTELIVSEGDKYTLHIKTHDGVTYKSAECKVLPKTTIDTVYFKKDQAWDDAGENLYEGLSFYVDGSAKDSTYVRVTYDEDWKFRSPYPERYIVLEDETIVGIDPLENWECWKHDSSIDINVFSFGNQVSSEIKEQKVHFVASELTDRLTVRYCLGVKQLTISKEEYEYWRKLSEATEDVGDVFGKQPYSITGNVYNVEDEDEPVLGFFQVGSVAFKRLYVDYDVLYDLDLPLYSGSCVRDSCLPEDYNDSYYEIYKTEVIDGNKYVCGLIYSRVGGAVIGLYISNRFCSDCSMTGSLKKPDFWEE